jgi:hypothetical protein
MTMTPSKYYLSLLLTISIIFISHASSPKLLYTNVCKQQISQERQQRCLKYLETHPEIILAKNHDKSCSFTSRLALEKGRHFQNYIKEMMTKYPSSEAIKLCATSCYDGILCEIRGYCNEDPELQDMVINTARDELARCERLLAEEKIVDVSSIHALNFDMEILMAVITT